MKKDTMKKDNKNLYSLLSEIKDKRRKQWTRHSLQNILLIAIMAIMNGSKSERSISRFTENNKQDLINYLGIKKERLPTRNTIRGILQTIDFSEFTRVFYKWTKTYVEIKEKEWISIDGKAIRWTVKDSNNSEQNFKSLVSIFASKRKQVITASKLETKKTNEIPVVQQLIKDLDLEDVVFTIDAMHCQKETTKIIVKNKNHYVIWVKGNQKKLLAQIKKIP